jgi:hypothetical protein
LAAPATSTAAALKQIFEKRRRIRVLPVALVAERLVQASRLLQRADARWG